MALGVLHVGTLNKKGPQDGDAGIVRCCFRTCMTAGTRTKFSSLPQEGAQLIADSHVQRPGVDLECRLGSLKQGFPTCFVQLSSAKTQSQKLCARARAPPPPPAPREALRFLRVFGHLIATHLHDLFFRTHMSLGGQLLSYWNNDS